MNNEHSNEKVEFLNITKDVLCYSLFDSLLLLREYDALYFGRLHIRDKSRRKVRKHVACQWEVFPRDVSLPRHLVDFAVYTFKEKMETYVNVSI